MGTTLSKIFASENVFFLYFQIMLICDYNIEHFGILQPMMLRNQLYNLSTKTEDVKSEMCYYAVIHFIYFYGLVYFPFKFAR